MSAGHLTAHRLPPSASASMPSTAAQSTDKKTALSVCLGLHPLRSAHPSYMSASAELLAPDGTAIITTVLRYGLLILLCRCSLIDIAALSEGEPGGGSPTGAGSITGITATNQTGSSNQKGSASTGVQCTPLVTPSNFLSVWQTPNTIRWDWTPGIQGNDAGLFGSYRLVLGPTRESVEMMDQAAGAVILDKQTNPEFAYYYYPGNGAQDAVFFSISSGLVPGETYFAMLLAEDSAGCAARSNVGQATTKRASSASRQLSLIHI